MNTIKTQHNDENKLEKNNKTSSFGIKQIYEFYMIFSWWNSPTIPLLLQHQPQQHQQ